MTDAWQRIAGLIRKELLAILKDSRTRVILVVPAILQSLIFGYAATFDLADVPYAVLDQSRSTASSELLAKLDGTGVFHRVATLTSSSQIAGMIDDGKALMVVAFQPNFAADLAHDSSAALQVIVDGRNSTTAGAAVGYVNAVVSRFNVEQLGQRPPLNVETRSWFNPNLQTRWNLVPALIASLSMLQTLLLTALSVAREREEGTFDQLLVTPLNSAEIMLGRALPPILVALVQATLILTVSMFWFRIPMAGSPFVLYAGLLLFAIASVGIGLSVSALSANMQQAMLYTFVLVMPMTLLSGLATPIENMPMAFQIGTLVNPLRFAIDLVMRVYLEGAGLRAIVVDLLPLIAIAAVTLPLAAGLFRNKLA